MKFVKSDDTMFLTYGNVGFIIAHELSHIVNQIVSFNPICVWLEKSIKISRYSSLKLKRGQQMSKLILMELKNA